MTSTEKQVRRESIGEHPRFKRHIVVQVGPGDVIGVRLARQRDIFYLPLQEVFDIAEKKRAVALSGFDPAPCKNPRS